MTLYADDYVMFWCKISDGSLINWLCNFPSIQHY